MAGKFRILKFKDGRGLQIVDHKVGNWVLMTVTPKGATVVKKGSWMVNWRLWKPRYYLTKGANFPKGLPQYVRDEVKAAWAALKNPNPKDVGVIIS